MAHKVVTSSSDDFQKFWDLAVKRGMVDIFTGTVCVGQFRYVDYGPSIAMVSLCGDQIMGMVICIVEKKLLHSCKSVLHVERLYVLERNLQSVQYTFDLIQSEAVKRSCYKVIFNNTSLFDEVIVESFGYKRAAVHMSLSPETLKSPLNIPYDFSFRQLQEDDITNEYLDLLSQLSDIGCTSTQMAKSHFQKIFQSDSTIQVFVLDNGQHIAASCSVVYSQFTKISYIEDVIVHKLFREHGLGKVLLTNALSSIRPECSSISLNCII